MNNLGDNLFTTTIILDNNDFVVVLISFQNESKMINANLDDIKNLEDPEEQVMALTAAINVVAELHCPLKLKNIKSKHTHWMDNKVKKLLVKRNKLFQLYANKVKQNNEKAKKQKSTRIEKQGKTKKNVHKI